MPIIVAAARGVSLTMSPLGGILRILRHGLAVAELAENDLPGVPSAVFAFKEVSHHVGPFRHTTCGGSPAAKELRLACF